MVERGRTWSDEEIEALLEIWGEDAIQQQLTGTVRNNVNSKRSHLHWRRRVTSALINNVAKKLKLSRRNTKKPSIDCVLAA